MVDQNLAHCACGRRKQMRSIIPGNVRLNELEINLMDKSSVLESMTLTLVLHFVPRQLAQFVINEGEQVVESHFGLRAEGQFNATAMKGEDVLSETPFIGRGT